MSIKTTKRLALGVIASLVFAPFAAIAPASATVGTYTPTLTSGTTTLTGTGTATASATGAVGTAVNFNLVVTGSGTPTAADDVVITPALTGTATTQGTGASERTKLTIANLAAPVSTLVNMTSTVASGVITNVTTATAAASATHNYTFTPDVSGTYVFTFVPTLSAGAPANAVFTYTATATDGSIYASTDSTGPLTDQLTAIGVSGPNNFVTVTQTAKAATAYNVVVTGSTATVTSGAGATGTGTSSIVAAVNTATVMNIPTPTAGTITVKNYAITNGVQSATATSTVTITVQDGSLTGTINAATSTSVIKAGATWAAGTSATTDVVSVTRAVTVPNAPTSVIKVTLAGAQGAITSTTPVTVVASGPASLVLNDENDTTSTPISSGKSISSTVATTTSTFHVFVLPEGVSGVASITITAGTFTATETVTFYGAAASYTATVVQGAVTANGTATTDAILVAAKDAAGVAVPGHTIYAFSSDTTKATVEASDITEATAIVTSGARPASLVAATPVGSVAFNVTGIATKSGEVTISFGNASTLATSTVTTTAKVIVSEVKANSVVLTADKTSYLPGELVTLTLTAKDKNGNPIADGPGTALLTGALTSSQAITSTLFGANVATLTGVATATFYAPLLEGTVALSGKVGVAGTYVETLYAGTAITLSISVAKPVVPVVVPEVVYDKPTLSFVKDGGRIILSGTAVDGEGDIIIYTKRIGTTAWKERAKTLEVAAPGDFNGSIKALKRNVVIRVKQEGTGLFSNQVIVVK